MKNFIKSVQKLLLSFTVLLISIVMICSTVFASGTIFKDYPEIYKQVAVNFFEEQYEQQKITYENVTIALEADLYDSEENVVAKSMVVNRDGKYDYVVLNLTDCSIDEFGFDDPTAYERFSEKIYYTGTLNYFKKENNKFKSVRTGEAYSSTIFENISQEITGKYKKFKKNASKTLKSGDNPLPNPDKDAYNGFYSHSDIDKFNKNNGYEFYDYEYNGVTPRGVEDGLSFFGQNQFNERYGTRASCLPTALTNLCVYLNWTGLTNKDSIVNVFYGDEYTTFKLFCELTGHDNEGAYFDWVPSAFKTYAEGQNYNYYVKENLTTFKEFKEHLHIGYPIVTYLRLNKNENLQKDFQHAVLTLGCLQYKYKSGPGLSKQSINNYLRVIDGWSSSNQGIFIDFSGYWDVLIGTALRLVN